MSTITSSTPLYGPHNRIERLLWGVEGSFTAKCTGCGAMAYSGSPQEVEEWIEKHAEKYRLS